MRSELDVVTGLASNAVRVIKKDSHGRLWLGTYNGLQILNNQDRYLDSLQKSFLNKPVWAVEFYKNIAIVGARFHGIYLFDLVRKSTIAHFDSSQIGLCRKFRLFNDTLFIATKSAPFYLSMKTFKLTAIKPGNLTGFCTDFANWDNSILASSYDIWNSPVFQIRSDSLAEDHHLDLKHFMPQNSSFTLETNDKGLILGGNGFNVVLNKNKTTLSESLSNPLTGKKLPAWDIKSVNGRTYVATGEPDNVQQGMIHEMFVTSGAELKNQFYCLSLAYDSAWGECGQVRKMQDYFIGQLLTRIITFRPIRRIHIVCSALIQGEPLFLMKFMHMS